MLLLLSRFSHVRLCATVMSDSVRPHRWHPTRLPRPWDSPGKNTGVGCHFLLQCVKSESEVAQSCPTLSEPMDDSLPGSSVHGIFQARVLEWGAIAFSGRSSQNRSTSASSVLLVGAQAWIIVILNGLPWKQTQINLLFLKIESKYCISDSFVDHDGYSISSEGFLPTVIDISSSELNSPIPVHFSSLIS